MIERLAVFCPSPLGDAVLATPVLKSLRLQYSRAFIVWVGTPAVQALYSGLPWADDFVLIPRNPGFFLQSCASLWRGIRALKRYRCDTGILLANSFRAALIFEEAGIPTRIGYKRDGRSLFLTRGPQPLQYKGRPVPVHMTDYYGRLLEELQCPLMFQETELLTTSQAEREGEEYLKRKGVSFQRSMLLMVPGAAYGPSKFWTSAGFSLVAEYFARKGFQMLISVGPGEEPLAHDILSQINRKNFPFSDSLFALIQPIPTIDQLKVLVRKVDGVITVDSGVRHIAHAFRIPTVTLFGPIHPAWTSRPNDLLEKSIYLQVECSPCSFKVCPIDHRCMERILPDQVIQEVESLLKKNAKIFCSRP